MKKLAIIAAVAAVALGSFGPTEAKEGRRTAAVVGAVTGLAAGAFIGSALSNAQAAPRYSYGPTHGYVPGPAYGYAPVRGYSSYGVAPAYGSRVVVQSHSHFDDFDDDCRIVIRRKVNSWGEVVTRREEICD